MDGKKSNIESTQINVPGLPNTDIKWIELIKQATKESYEGNSKNKFIFDEQVLFPTEPLKQETSHIVIDPVDPNPTFSVTNTKK